MEAVDAPGCKVAEKVLGTRRLEGEDDDHPAGDGRGGRDVHNRAQTPSGSGWRRLCHPLPPILENVNAPTHLTCRAQIWVTLICRWTVQITLLLVSKRHSRVRSKSKNCI